MSDDHLVDGENPTSSSITGLVVAVLLVSALMIWWAITLGLSVDELLYLRAIDLGPVDSLMSKGSSHPPLFRWIAGAFLDGSAPDWMLRIPSILCTVATLFVWHLIFRRLFDDRIIAGLVLLLTACNIHWLEHGFQLLPYTFLTLLGSAHCLFWLRTIENPNLRNIAGFALTGAATFWTHFYGLNLLVADQIIWICLVLRNRHYLKTWMTASIASFILASPMLPIAWFYAQTEKPFALVEIDDFKLYFVLYSQQFFSTSTFNLTFLGSLLIGWYAIVLNVFLKFFTDDVTWPKNEAPDPVCKRRIQLLILAGLFLAGLPAAQAHSLISAKAMWPRYTLVASWTHWPLLFLFMSQFSIPVSKKKTIAILGIAVCVCGLVVNKVFKQQVMFSYAPEVQLIKEHSQPGDGFFAQDFDFFVGPANIDRLWFERYSPVEMEVFSGEIAGRFEIYRRGVNFESVPESVNRFWVCSSMFRPNQFNTDQEPGWDLVLQETPHGSIFPIALFERTDRKSDEPEDE